MTDLQPAIDKMNEMAPLLGITVELTEKNFPGNVPHLILADMVNLINEGSDVVGLKEVPTEAMYSEAFGRLARQSDKMFGRVLPIDRFWMRTTYGKVYMALLRGKPVKSDVTPVTAFPDIEPNLQRIESELAAIRRKVG